MADIVKLIYKWDEMAQWGGWSSNTLHITDVNKRTWYVKTKWESKSITFEAPHDWFIVVRWTEYYTNWYSLNDIDVTSTWWAVVFTREYVQDVDWTYQAPFSWTMRFNRRTVFPIPAWTITVTAKINDIAEAPAFPDSVWVEAIAREYYYFG